MVANVVLQAHWARCSKHMVASMVLQAHWTRRKNHVVANMMLQAHGTGVWQHGATMAHRTAMVHDAVQ